MNNCQDSLREVMPEYARGLLDEGDSRRVEEHLKNCPDCASELLIFRQLESRTLREPPPWFFTSLPGKVTARVEAHRRKRARWMIPAWAGGMAAAVIAVLMLLQPRPAPQLENNISDYSLLQTEESLSLGIEEEFLALSAVSIDDLERTLGLDLKSVPDGSMITMDLVPEGDGYESMGEETMKVFEDLLEKMAPEWARKRVTS